MIDFYIDTVWEKPIEFDCGFEVFNNYIMDNDDSAVIHYIIDSDSDKIIAYFSLLSSALLFGNINNLTSIPAVELKMFAINKLYQKLGLSQRLLNAVEITVKSYTLEYIGAKLIILYSVPIDKVVNLYEQFGFNKTEGLFSTYRSYFNDSCVPMFKVINK